MSVGQTGTSSESAIFQDGLFWKVVCTFWNSKKFKRAFPIVLNGLEGCRALIFLLLVIVFTSLHRHSSFSIAANSVLDLVSCSLRFTIPVSHLFKVDFSSFMSSLIFLLLVDLLVGMLGIWQLFFYGAMFTMFVLLPYSSYTIVLWVIPCSLILKGLIAVTLKGKISGT